MYHDITASLLPELLPDLTQLPATKLSDETRISVVGYDHGSHLYLDPSVDTLLRDQMAMAKAKWLSYQLQQQKFVSSIQSSLVLLLGDSYSQLYGSSGV